MFDMKQLDKINSLKENHFKEWNKKRNEVEDLISSNQTIFCLCGKLATGLHERNCKKFNTFIDKQTLNELQYLLK